MSKNTTTTSGEGSGRSRGTQKPKSNQQHGEEHEQACGSVADMTAVLTELKALRSDFVSKFDTTNCHLKDMNNSINALEQSMIEVRNNVASNTTRVTEAEERISSLEDDLEVAKAELATAAKRIALLETKADDLENRGRRKNLRMFGLREDSELNRSLLDFVEHKLPTWLKLDGDRSFTLERVHRTPARPKPGQSRAVIIRFLKFQDREFVLRTARQLSITHEENKLTFAPDLSVETMRQRNEFNMVRKKFVEKGLFRGFQIYPCKLRVLYEGRIQLFATPREAEDFYQKIT